MKKELVNSYKIWNGSFYTIEANIDTDLWCQDLVNSFEKKINKILKEFPDEIINITPEDKILISIMFSGDKKVMELNSQFRKINKPTNVLSFPSSTDASRNFKNVFLGDIIFSLETVISESKANRTKWNFPFIRQEDLDHTIQNKEELTRAHICLVFSPNCCDMLVDVLAGLALNSVRVLENTC